MNSVNEGDPLAAMSVLSSPKNSRTLAVKAAPAVFGT
jgi:hypothetical protein